MAAGIVGSVDLRLPSARDAFEAHLEAATARFQGVRQEALWDEDPTILAGVFDHGPGMYLRDDFQRDSPTSHRGRGV
ncbi:hypothetical protein [Rhodococcus tibetensis]|uniref:Uncharacterized protein n=1 Tax=Rhodococcus tibetensis TaxID=2965064 RepID=A0ABT1Q812_9NOCA|nr:hypothetical protein [Rhodococcus sp. FXJ9.536]MCQ4118389.1 hypothetical protein [Rhodococcus sp. FXJ9.536]